ncbi:MAG TPA: adenylate/guanylate cyclase domain-containing protein [Leptospiraceae bacterium]|nr:adenylate/guanylate cyclase domain-containing protein [Leptospiraceae bacterium]HMW06547.1 adenylate/guanylate cyclase domain-containing protein [Leptospiraceae bacterium]HMX35243.1 adenylate/guanylate cyclase domain-containing protein [Leptospiraceae bacterium]HMY31263.1 adenylate/guanylate cyclase domain-containing protein [Leptospiraceae bacterium]HNA10340.1 adenylate/guanylate cyclase domain-containing protein [Leptospiraceae bacterium]
MLQLLWNQIAYMGVQHVPNITEHKHVVLVNTLSLFIPVFTFLNLITILSFGIPPVYIYGSIAYILLLPFAIVLNGNGKMKLARIHLFTLSIAYLLLLTFMQGNQIKGHIFFLAEAFVVFFIFPAKEKKLMFLFVVFLTGLYIAFDIFHDQLTPIVIQTPDKIKIANLITDISFAFILIGFAFYIHITFQRTELFMQLEHDKSEKLLQNILPISIIKKLRENPDTIAERFEDCTVLFSDIVGFTQMSKTMPAVSIVKLLNEIFSRFDDLAEKYKLEKIKTIGDAYMVVGGLPEPDEDHAKKVASFALEMLEIINDYRKEKNIPIEVRIGINSGAAVAGVIGKKKFIYDLWGDSVNTASRMESHGVPGHIQVSESTYRHLKDLFQFKDRGVLEVKGLGAVQSYLLTAKIG